MNRRTVLQGLGTGAIAGVGLVGTASAHWVREKPVFCGCSQICVDMVGNADVLMARKTDDGEYDIGFIVGDGELDPYPQGEPRFSGNFCVSTDDENVPDGKIIGLQVAGTRWVNPNQCAQEALEAERKQLASKHPRPEGDSGGQCGKGDEDGDGDTSNIEVTWEDCETVSVTGSDEGLDGITVHYTLCHESGGPCPDGVQRSIDDPELPLTIEDQYLTVEDVDYNIAMIELSGDVEQDIFERPDDLDCSFE